MPVSSQANSPSKSVRDIYVMLYSPTVEIIEESFNVRVVTAVKYIVKSPMPIAPSAKRRASEMSITKRLERENDSGNSLNGGVIIEISVWSERQRSMQAGGAAGAGSIRLCSEFSVNSRFPW